MKERRAESLSFFRRSRNRRSVHLENTPVKEEETRLKRSSWSSFPLMKFNLSDEKTQKKSLSTKSQSDEKTEGSSLVFGANANCGFLKGSASSLRNFFASSTYSSDSTPSLCNSPRAVGTSASSGSSIASILEGSASEASSESANSSPTQIQNEKKLSSFTVINNLRDLEQQPHEPHGTALPCPKALVSQYSHKKAQTKTSAPRVVFIHKKDPGMPQRLKNKFNEDNHLSHGALQSSEQVKTCQRPPFDSFSSSEHSQFLLNSVKANGSLSNSQQRSQALSGPEKKSGSLFGNRKNFRFFSNPKTNKKYENTHCLPKHGHELPTGTSDACSLTGSDRGTFSSYKETHNPYFLNHLGAKVYQMSSQSDCLVDRPLNKDAFSNTYHKWTDERDSQQCPEQSGPWTVNSENQLHPRKQVSYENCDCHSLNLNTPDGEVFILGKNSSHDNNNSLFNSCCTSESNESVHEQRNDCRGPQREPQDVIRPASGNSSASPPSFEDTDTFHGNAATSSPQYPLSCVSNEYKTPTSTALIDNTITEEDEGSDCDTWESQEFGTEADSFEKRFENELEMIDASAEDSGRHDSEPQKSMEAKVNKMNARANLKLDLSHSPQWARIQGEENSLTQRSSEVTFADHEKVVLRRTVSASPTTTQRSPIIDIDDVFKQKQKKIEENVLDDLSKAKILAKKLKLPTRRESFLQWQAVTKDPPKSKLPLESFLPQVLEGDEHEERHQIEQGNNINISQRKQNLQKALEWLRSELKQMQSQDQELARELMKLQLEIQRLRLLRSCTNHQALVEEVTCETEEQKAFMSSSDLCETPTELRDISPLTSQLLNIGITKMNITNRRFTLR